MRWRIAHILPPRGPACAPCEPRGRVWRDPAMASQRNRTAADVARPPRAPIAANMGSLDAPENYPHFAAPRAQVRGL